MKSLPNYDLTIHLGCSHANMVYLRAPHARTHAFSLLCKASRVKRSHTYASLWKLEAGTLRRHVHRVLRFLRLIMLANTFMISFFISEAVQPGRRAEKSGLGLVARLSRKRSVKPPRSAFAFCVSRPPICARFARANHEQQAPKYTKSGIQNCR